MKQWLWDHLRSTMGLWFATLLAKGAGLVTRILSMLGLGWVATSYVMPQVKEAIAPYFSGLSQPVLNLISYTNADKAITLILSALAFKFAGTLVFARAATWQSH